MGGRMWYTADIQEPFSLREKCRPGKCTFFYLFFQFTMIPETTKDPGSICTIASASRVLLIYMLLLVTFIQSIFLPLSEFHIALDAQVRSIQPVKFRSRAVYLRQSPQFIFRILQSQMRVGIHRYADVSSVRVYVIFIVLSAFFTTAELRLLILAR